MRQAIIKMTAAIEKGTGKLVLVDKTSSLVSRQWVPLVSNPAGQSVRQAPFNKLLSLSQVVQTSADVH